MFLNLFLACSLYLASDREHFWDPDEVAIHTQVIHDGAFNPVAVNLKKLKGKKVLLLVHGYNNSADEVLSAYRLVTTHVSALYDVVIGYLWPGYHSRLEYFAAKKHVISLVRRMREHIHLLATNASQFDIMAHSMGNFLVFEALDYAPERNQRPIKNLYSLAAAIDNESIEKKKKYFYATKNCQNVYIFYSKRDDVLNYFYRLAEFDKALGFEGVENPKRLPKNVQLVDCTNIIASHGQYFTAFPVYEFIKKQHTALSLSPYVEITADNDIETVR